MTELILELVLTIISLIASKYIIPWLKEKRMMSSAKIIVQAAEQIFTESKAGKEKMAQALTWFCKKFKVSEDEAKKFLEAAVYKMKQKQEK